MNGTRRFEHEENPLWIWLVNWGAAAFLGAAAHLRRSPARAARSPT